MTKRSAPNAPIGAPPAHHAPPAKRYAKPPNGDDRHQQQDDWDAEVGDMLLIRPPHATVEKGAQPFWIARVKAITPTGYAFQYWTRNHEWKVEDGDDPYEASYVAQQRHVNVPTNALEHMTFFEAAGRIYEVLDMVPCPGHSDRLKMHKLVSVAFAKYWAKHWASIWEDDSPSRN